FPIIADTKRDIAELLGMLDAVSLAAAAVGDVTCNCQQRRTGLPFFCVYQSTALTDVSTVSPARPRTGCATVCDQHCYFDVCPSSVQAALQDEKDAAGLPVTVRKVFIIGADKKVKAILAYPTGASVVWRLVPIFTRACAAIEHDKLA